MRSAPRLSIGLPVYNGEGLLSEAIEALLGQSFQNFELIISDNASTDGTESICRHYSERDSRVRYIRQPHDIGMVPNHNFLARRAAGEYFKWASHDDLYARDYLRSCVGVLDEHPEAALAHAWCVLISEDREPIQFFKYPTATSLPRAPDRFRSLLFDGPYDWTYAVFRTEILRKTALHGTYHFADRTLMAEFALHGKLLQVPEWMYFRRDHPNRHQSPRARSAGFDPRRANRLRHPSARLYSEYVWGYASAVNRSRLSRREKGECYRELVRWLATRIAPSAQPEEERETFRTQPVLHVLRRLAGIAHQERELPVGEVATHELPDIRVDELVLGQDS